MANEYGTKPWFHRPAFNLTAGAATDLLAAGVASCALIVCNEDAAIAIRVRFDGEDATATTGFLLAAGQVLYFANGEVPAGKVSAFCASAVQVSVHCIQ